MIESIATILNHRHDPIHTMAIHYIKTMGGLSTMNIYTRLSDLFLDMTEISSLVVDGHRAMNH